MSADGEVRLALYEAIAAVSDQLESEGNLTILLQHAYFAGEFELVWEELGLLAHSLPESDWRRDAVLERIATAKNAIYNAEADS